MRDVSRMVSDVPAPLVMVGAVPPGHLTVPGHPVMLKAPVLAISSVSLPNAPAAGQFDTVKVVTFAASESATSQPSAILIARVAELAVTAWLVTTWEADWLKNE